MIDELDDDYDFDDFVLFDLGLVTDVWQNRRLVDESCALRLLG